MPERGILCNDVGRTDRFADSEVVMTWMHALSRQVSRQVSGVEAGGRFCTRIVKKSRSDLRLLSGITVNGAVSSSRPQAHMTCPAHMQGPGESDRTPITGGKYVFRGFTGLTGKVLGVLVVKASS